MPERNRIQQLREERANVWAQMQDVMKDADEANRDLSAEERQKWDAAEARLSELSGDIERRETQARLDALDAPSPPAPAGSAAGETDEARSEARYTDAFRAWAAYGMEGLDADQRQLMAPRRGEVTPEMRAQSTGTTTAGGFFVPQGYWARISEAMKAFGGLYSRANVITTATGQLLPWPNNDDTSNVGAILGENAQVSEVDLVLGQRTLNAWTYTSNSVLVSLQLLQDSAFDLDTWVPGKLGVRVARAVANHLVNGTGSSQPLGITVAGTGYTPAIGVTLATGNTTSVTYAGLVDLKHSVDPAYRMGGNAAFLMADTTIATVRKLVDGQQRPLWEPSVQAGDPDRILGDPIQVDQAMPVPAANATPIAYGDFHEGVVVRQVLGFQMLRLVERYADFLQVGFLGFSRIDARPDNGSAFKFLKNSAT